MLWDTPKPQKGTWFYKFCAFFVDHINFCEGYYYGTEIEKPENIVYNWLYSHWLFPFKQNGCVCCNVVRGVLYGAVIGFIFGSFL